MNPVTPPMPVLEAQPERPAGAGAPPPLSPPLQDFESLALPHTNDLFRMAVSLLRNREHAEDAVQETLLQGWKSFHRFEPGTNCRAWLFKILFHVVSHQRRKWQRMWLAEDPQILEETLAARPDIPDQLTDEDILAAFGRIPQRYAEVVMLADVHEFTYREIQETLGIPIGTVMSRLSRGREYLRAELAPHAPAYVERGAFGTG